MSSRTIRFSWTVDSSRLWGPPFSWMIQSINLFRWNCLWKTFPCWNKTCIDNTSLWRFFKDILKRATLHYQDNDCVTPLIFSWEITSDCIKRVFILNMSDIQDWLFSALGVCVVNKKETSFVHWKPFIKCSCVMHFKTETPLSLNVYHQFANEPIKQHETHNAVVQTNPAKAFPIVVYSLLITAQQGFLWHGNICHILQCKATIVYLCSCLKTAEHPFPLSKKS